MTHKQWEMLEVVTRDPMIMSGAWIFQGTCVPVATLFENIRDGARIDEFLAWFPGVSRSQVEAVLNAEIQALSGAVDT